MITNVFAMTHNVKAFVAAVDRLRNTPEDMPRMGLIYSEPGRGKTDTVAWYVINNGGVHVTALEIMTPRWFLRTLVREMGTEPAYRTEDVYEQALGLLGERNEPIFIDEADFLIKERISEVLRNLHDLTRTPIIFIGMEAAKKKFMRHRHLYDRFTEIVEFSPLTAQDVGSITERLCETKLTDDAIKFVTDYSNGNFRRVKKLLRQAERIANTNGLRKVSAADIKGTRQK